MIGTTPVTLVTGGTAGEREAAIAATLLANRGAQASHTKGTVAIVLEGVPNGTDSFAAIQNHFSHLSIVRIAPGCPCCIGNLTMRVTLNRILRHPPVWLFLSLATQTHLDQLRMFLSQDPYDKLLHWAKDIAV